MSLPVDTSMIVVYDTALSYEAVAGVGPFNASLVDRFMDYMSSPLPGDDTQVLPYTYYSVVHNLVTNPVFSNVHEPVSCDGLARDCTSYVLSGGSMMSATWQPDGHQQHPLLQIPRVPVIQIDFDNRSKRNHPLNMTDCDVFGADLTPIGIRFCLSLSDKLPGAVDASLFVCNKGTSEGACLTQQSLPNLTTTVSFYERQADVLVSRMNSSILLVSDLSTPSLVPVREADLYKYRRALKWLLDYSQATIPAPSSIVESFYTGRDLLATQHMSYGYLAQQFHSILAFPVWFFNVNNYGNIDLPSGNTSTATYLPPKFHIEAHVVAPFHMIKLSLPMIILFASTQGLVLVFAWVMLIWAAAVSPSLPCVSSFPLFDFAFKTDTKMDGNSGPDEVWEADDSKIEQMLKQARVRRRAV